jgi:hypothetical protein
MFRTSVCVCVILLLVCGVVPVLAQQPADQANEIRCSGGGATCKTGFVPRFGSNGGSATVNDSIISQTGTNIKIAGTESVNGSFSSGGNVSASGNIHAGGSISASGSVSGATLSGNGAGVTNVNASTLNGLGSGAFALLSGDNNFNGNEGINGTLGVSGGERFNNTIQFTDDGTTNVQPSLMINAVDCCNFGNRMIWAHSPAFPFWGIYYDDSVDTMRFQQNFGVNEMLLDFTTGNLSVTGAITAGVKDFKIDHPLDPKNKYLYHSSVESSEMMNIYTGNAILDNSGEVVVSLPKWFDALNGDFRYQLTAVGAAAPNLHVAQEIANHQFSIAGGASGMKVSWQVTGVRHDAYAKAHPLVVEVKKPEKERGHYLHPDAFGAPRLTQEQMLRQRR